MAQKYDVVATVGTYEKDGETKYKNRNVGAIIQTKHGFRLKMDASFNPAGCPRDDDGSVWLALFEPMPRDQRQAPQQAGQNFQHPPNDGADNYRQQAQGGQKPVGDPGFDDDLSDDIPF